MTYIQYRQLKYFGMVLSIVLLAVITTMWFIYQYQSTYAEKMNELESLNQVEVQALKTQYLFKRQVQEWKNILLRGQSSSDFNKYLQLFKQEFAATQQSANHLYEIINDQSPTKQLTDEFRTSHRKMLEEYASALDVFSAFKFDAQKSDAEVRGIDREATLILDEVVSILETEVDSKRDAILYRLNSHTYLYSFAFLTFQVLFSWMAIRLTAALLKSGLTDKTTQIGNRELFVDTISDAIKKNQKLCIAIYDINNFKIINEAFGNHGGDSFLRLLAAKIKRSRCPKETLCRVGGDMLGLILNCDDPNESSKRIQMIKTLIEKFEYQQDNIRMSLTASVGIFSMHSSVEKNSEQILNNLYASLQEAKSQGKNKMVLYSSESAEINQRRAQMQKVREINDALENNQIVLFRQKVQDLSGAQHGDYFEILMRVKDHQGEYKAPGLFIAAAERFSMMEAIDRYIIQSTVEFLGAASSKTENYAINLSGATLSDTSFIDFIKAVFDNSKLPFERISFEITETDIVKNFKTASSIIAVLKSYGCQVALHDFGKGMSSYSYLTELDIDKIKIDGTFIKDINEKPYNRAIIKSVVNLSQDLGIRTVAEFVETQDELLAIKQLGINYAQGYLVHKPEFLYHPVRRTAKNQQHEHAA